MGGEAALSVEARYLEPDLPIELVDAYAQTFERLRRLFRARGCTPEEAADLAQEAAVRAFVHIRRWGVAGAGLDPLLNRISRNLLIDRYRRGTPHLVPLESAGELLDPEQDPTEDFARRQRRRAVRSAISELPKRHQTAITYSLNGMTPEEVGKHMGIGRNAADALLHRARRSLKERLTAVGEGVWGVALGMRVRWDRLTRRGPLQGSLPDAVRSVGMQSSLSIATATVVAVMSFGGFGGGGSGRVPSTVMAKGVAAVVSGARGSSVGGAPAQAGVPSGGSGSGIHTYHFGPATRTVGPTGTTTTVSGPDAGNGNPIFRLTDRSYGTTEPPANDGVGNSLKKITDAICPVYAGTC